MRARRIPVPPWILWLWPALCCAVPAVGGESAAAHAVIDTLTVTAPRSERFLASAATVTVLDLDGDGARTDLAEFLEEATGLQIRRYGGLGAPALASIRGSSATQVSILIDGLPLSDAMTGLVDLSTLPLDRFVRAEVYRGASPLGGAGAGAVNLVTRDVGRPGTELRISAGSFGEAGARLTSDARLAGVDALLLLHGRRSDGQYRYLDDKWTPFNPDDDEIVERRNAWFHEGGASLVLNRRPWAGPQVRLALGLYERDAGRSGPTGDRASPNARTGTSRLDAHLRLSDDEDEYGLEASWRSDLDSLDDPEGEVSRPAGLAEGRAGHGLVHAYASRDLALPGGLGQTTWLLSGAWRHETHRRLFDGAEDPLRTRATWEAAADLAWDLAGDRLHLAPSVRWRKHTDDFPPQPVLPGPAAPGPGDSRVFEAWSPAAALVWEARSGRLFVEARRFRNHRAPSWAELFGAPGGLSGNRELTPERLDGRELSLRLSDRGLRLRWSWFRTDVEDAIVWYPNSQATSKAHNVGTTRTTGQELELGLDLSRAASCWLSLTAQNPRDRGIDPVYADKELPHQPRWTVATGGSLDVGDWTLRTRVIAEAGHWRDRYNGPGARVESRALVSAAVSRRWWQVPAAAGHDLVATLEILNLTDTLARDLDGYPLPGRSLRFTLNVR